MFINIFTTKIFFNKLLQLFFLNFTYFFLSFTIHLPKLNNIEFEFNEEIRVYNENYQNQLNELNNNSNIIRSHTKEKHQQEEDELIRNFEEKFPSQPKFSSEVLNLQKQMEEYIKKKEYEKANETKIRIIQLCSEQDNKWKTETHDKKLNSEIEKLRMRQGNEMKKLEQKIKLTYDEYDKKYNTTINVMNQKYKNKKKDMINDHITSKNSFKKPSKQSLIKKIGNNTFSTQTQNNNPISTENMEQTQS